MADKVKETAIEEVERVRVLARDAAKSGAYIYPLKGIVYFITHRTLWKPLVSKLAPSVGLGTGVTAFMFIFTYLPQAALLTLMNGPLAVLTTILLVLSESSTIFMVLSKSLFINDALIDTFDGTLMSRNMSAIVSEGRQIRSGSEPMERLGKILKRPFQRFTPKAMIRYFMYLPLNFIPVVGTAIFILLQGKRFGPEAHARYFQLKQMSGHQRDQFIEQRRAAYTSFGVGAVLLELIPVAGIFFAFTNTVGAALWAADMEQKNTTAPGLRQQARQVEKKEL